MKAVLNFVLWPILIMGLPVLVFFWLGTVIITTVYDKAFEVLE